MKAVTYAEVDLPRCGLTYGRWPCQALMVGEVTRTYDWVFNGSIEDWVIGQNCTLTPTLAGMQVINTSTSGRFQTPAALGIDGATDYLMEIEFTRVARGAGSTFLGHVGFLTDEPGDSIEVYTEYGAFEDAEVGERVRRTINFSTEPTAGTNWTSWTVNIIRIAFDDGAAGSEFIVHNVRIGHAATAEEATGTAKCFNTLATCQDVEHYDTTEFAPTSLGAKIEAFTSTPNAATFNITSRSWGAVAGDNEFRRVVIALQAYHPSGAPALSTARIGDSAAIIRESRLSGDVGTYLIESINDPTGTSGTLALTFAGTVQDIAGTSYRMINAEFVSSVDDATLPDPQQTTDVEHVDMVLASVAAYYMSTTVWTGVTEDTDSAIADFFFSTGTYDKLTSMPETGLLVKADNDYKSVAAPTVVTSFYTASGSLPHAISITALQGDVIIYAIETAQEGISIPAECAALTGNISASTPATRLNVYWERAASDLVAANRQFNLSGADDHIVIMAVVLRNVFPTTGDPHIEVVTGSTTGPVSSATIPGLTLPTTVKNGLVLDIIARGSDLAGAQFSGWANADLTSLTEINDDGTGLGNGGGVAMHYGIKMAMGSVGDTTVNLDTATSVAFCKILFVPTSYADAANALLVARYRWVPPEVGTEETIRFGMDTGFNDPDIDSINCIESYSHTPTVISLGEDLGTREGISFSMRDLLHSDVGPAFDPYWRERGYDPYNQGSLWPRFLARYPYFGGRSLRWYEGYADQALADMDIRHFLVENISGPDARGSVTLVAKDPLKLLDSDKSLAPRTSLGYLLNDITNVATSATLTPFGVGDQDYPSSGKATIAGNELVNYTRTEDALTLTRAQDGTTAEAHTQQDAFQVALVYDAMDPADIIYDLMVTYGGVDPAWIALGDWQAETSAYLRRNYSAIIGEPTSVKKLIAELIISCGLAIWWDSLEQKIRLTVLRQIPADATLIDASIRVESAPTPRYQPEKRVSQVLVHFAIRDPLKSITDKNNFRQRALVVSEDSERNYGSSSIKSVFSRWIAPFARTTAIRVGDLNIGRFEKAPRKFTFTLPRDGTVIPTPGGAYRIQAKNLQEADGSMSVVPVQMTSVQVLRDVYGCEAEEMQFTSLSEEDLADRVITISGTQYNLNLKDIHDDIYPALREGDSVTFIFDVTSKVGSNSHTLPAVRTGTGWGTIVPHLEVKGKIQGKGGTGGIGRSADGGDPTVSQRNGTAGGTALLVEEPVTLTDTEGQIWGGGGGGAGGSCADLGNHRGGGGGGGAGLPGGDGGLGPGNGEDGDPGTETAGGDGGRSYTSSTFWSSPELKSNIRGGDGGAPGAAGSNDVGNYDLSGGSPGAAGNSIDGIADVTTIGTAGDRLGPQV